MLSIDSLRRDSIRFTGASALLLASSLASAATTAAPNYKNVDSDATFSDVGPNGIEAALPQQQAAAAEKQAAKTPEAAKAADEKLAKLEAVVEQRAAANPQSLPVQHSAARYAMQAGDFKTALARADTAVGLAVAGGEPRALEAAETTRAMARYAGRDFAGACADAEAALKGGAKNVTAYEVKMLACGRDASGTLVKDFDVNKLLAQQAPPAVAPHTPEQWTANQQAKRGAAFAGVAQAMKARKSGDAAGALKAAEAAVAADPRDAMAYAARGLARSDLGQFDQAILDISRAIAMGMVWDVLYRIRAQALLKAGQAKAAAQDAELALLLNPKDAASYATRGAARLAGAGAPDLALADLGMAASLDPKYADMLAQARRDLAASQAAPQESKPSAASASGPPWWAAGRALAAGMALVILVIAAAATVLLKPQKRADESVVGGCYRLGRRLGAGGMGVVYEAWDTNLERKVAVKRMTESLRDDPDEAARFVKEAKTVASLKHPGIVAIHDAFQDQGELYIVFELVEGETLDELVERRGGKLPPAEALKWLSPICEALDYAHARGVIHRDLKLSNVMVEEGRIKLMDFGIARRTARPDGRTLTKSIIGTPAYMAPEQERGEVSRQTDVYAAGVLAYRLLAGRLPFPTGDLAAKEAARFAPAGVPSMEAALARALDPEPARRYASAGELLEALRAAAPA